MGSLPQGEFVEAVDGGEGNAGVMDRTFSKIKIESKN
jgi:hypothetical protein